MITNSSCRVLFYDYCNVFTKLFTVISAFVLLLLMTTSIMNAQCYDYCSQGYFYMDVSTTPTICFTVPQGESRVVCLEFSLSWVGGAGCNGNATVTLGIYNQFGQLADSTCPSPMHWTFTANNPPTPTGNCPNGSGVRCCCFNPEDYYVRIIDSNGNDYSACYTGHVKGCITCYKQVCQ